jgi:hypothetical protein
LPLAPAHATCNLSAPTPVQISDFRETMCTCRNARIRNI